MIEIGTPRQSEASVGFLEYTKVSRRAVPSNIRMSHKYWRIRKYTAVLDHVLPVIAILYSSNSHFTS